MSVFDLHSAILADYRDFVESFFTIADDRTREFIANCDLQCYTEGRGLSAFSIP